jgi:hypothetical protein
MKTESLKRNFTRIKRKFTVFYLRLFKSFGQDKRVRRPKKLTEAEDTACEIFLTILHNKDSKLHYDIQTQECYISSSDKTLFVFLEAGNVKIINSVFGYDVHIRSELEGYLLDKFIREMSIRRNAFKNEVLSKINHSLDSTLSKIKDLDIETKSKN